MREIKFRGYDGADWIYGSAVRYDSAIDTWYMIENGAPDDDWMMVGKVGQYTGLKDKNGKEIYEGDIVSDGYGTGVVKWISEHCAFLLFLKNPSSYHYLESDGQLTKTKVIGNIHEKPELLGESNVC